MKLKTKVYILFAFMLGLTIGLWSMFVIDLILK